ncbi:hypothetical protein MNB_SM-7-218 [hydrothermal vent metagenome]|uniref:TIGR02453 family protein n=1 Tax=hydrothermal vent metagenome TaxID=652676 RepID=A0A1W1B913_9ZZZZ
MQFKGFPSEALDLLARIGQNNTKEWFEAHKSEYEEYILTPSRIFVEEMGDHLLALEPTINYAPKINYSLFRIYRDIRRMGYDKRPIKERIGFIWWQGGGKRLQSSSFYMHFDKSELFAFVGVRWFEKPLLDAYREFIKEDKNRQRLAKIIEEIKQKGYSTIEQGYKRLPRGFDSSMSYVDLALYKGMATYKKLPSDLVTDGEKLIDTLFKIYEDMLPLQQIVYEITLRVKT